MITAATASAIITEHPSGAADPTLWRVQDLTDQVVRQGVNISLKSLQVWADLARQPALTALGSATATCDLLEKLLAAQGEIVDELVAAQRRVAQGCLDAAAGDRIASR
jgi:hypothetical protein